MNTKLVAVATNLTLENKPDAVGITKEIIKEIAMDIGKDTVAYVEVMYPEAIKAASSTFKLSLRNYIFNEIMASIELDNPEPIRQRLEKRRQFRRKWLAQYRKIRKAK